MRCQSLLPIEPQLLHVCVKHTDNKTIFFFLFFLLLLLPSVKWLSLKQRSPPTKADRTNPLAFSLAFLPFPTMSLSPTPVSDFLIHTNKRSTKDEQWREWNYHNTCVFKSIAICSVEFIVFRSGFVVFRSRFHSHQTMPQLKIQAKQK